MTRKPSSTAPKPDLVFRDENLYRSGTAGAMLRPPVSERRMRKIAQTTGRGLMFGRTLFFTEAEIADIQAKRKVERRKKT